MQELKNKTLIYWQTRFLSRALVEIFWNKVHFQKNKDFYPKIKYNCQNAQKPDSNTLFLHQNATNPRVVVVLSFSDPFKLLGKIELVYVLPSWLRHGNWLALQILRFKQAKKAETHETKWKDNWKFERQTAPQAKFSKIYYVLTFFALIWK